MPAAPLTTDKPLNPRQELFAQALARGMSQRAAYLEAGYTDGRHAGELMAKPNVRARIAQLMAETAARNRVSIDSISHRILTIAERNEAAESVAAQNLAQKALMNVARINGLTNPKPAKPAFEPVTEIRRLIVYPDGYTTDYNGNPLDPNRPPYDASFRWGIDEPAK